MGDVPLPIPTMDWHNAGHPPAFAHGQPSPCPFCRPSPSPEAVAVEALRRIAASLTGIVAIADDALAELDRKESIEDAYERHLRQCANDHRLNCGCGYRTSLCR